VNRLQVAFIITELDAGGAERCLVNLALGLDRRRFEPAVLCLAARPADDCLVRELTAGEIPVQFLHARSAWQFFATKFRLRRLLAARPPQIVQTFLFHANVLGSLAARKLRGTRIALGVRVADPSRWRLRLEARMARGAERVVCVSRDVADFVRDDGGLPESKLAVIPNGLDLTRFDAAARAALTAAPPAPDREIMLFVGRLHRQKGLDWLLPRCPEIFRQLPDYDLVIVGEGPQSRELHALSTALGVDSRVHFAGQRNDVPALMRRSRMLILPSRWEGMPNAVLEAMGAELPVVCARVQSVAELLGDEAGPQTAAVGDERGFVNQLISIGRDADLRSLLGRKNRRRVEQAFSLELMVKRYAALYESLVGGG
jgi:glycosyltransferase involved in cell wall biosynthesis